MIWTFEWTQVKVKDSPKTPGAVVMQGNATIGEFYVRPGGEANMLGNAVI